MISSSEFAQFRKRIVSKEANIGVIGLGYVGLPLVRFFVDAGFRVLGFETDAIKAQRLNAGESYIRHIPAAVIQGMRDSGLFEATTDKERLAEPDAILICVPTPLTKTREPDMTYVEKTSHSIAAALRLGQLVILESTTYPGTTRNVMQPILEEGGLRAEEDFFLAYSSEREDPGNPGRSADSIPKVVGGIGPRSLDVASALYGTIVPRIVAVSSPEVAEASKILENTYRAVNIALVNELKMLFDRMDINIWEVIEAASTKPFGFHPFYPGPGLGGHCIPIDPFYLAWVAKQVDFSTRFIELAGEINTRMPRYVIERVLLALNSVGKPVRGSNIGILGMAYKPNVDDPRESPSFELMRRLLELGAEVSYNDPYIPTLPAMRKYDLAMDSSELTADYLESLDLVLIATNHADYDYAFIVDHAALLVDTRNATGDLTFGREKIWMA
ncbi:UDP-N-acetyl-D-glucosamine 6-dehydrogenase [Planctomycetes bacterium Pan216]|uniref:UDP-N-acetyl-D-glucosamine 6-dehydrogenase n=1 Tax=Kolteria novifilia TaxID=2527975 RepID=A0A518B9I9_9BACT|nr:UDP-N-acetyl-D-glucosamine 6-dehydrogenase [Planctomycetes bacterium Pan216]